MVELLDSLGIDDQVEAFGESWVLYLSMIVLIMFLFDWNESRVMKTRLKGQIPRIDTSKKNRFTFILERRGTT